MKKIIITLDKDHSASDTVQHVAQLLENGFTSGYDPVWYIADDASAGGFSNVSASMYSETNIEPITKRGNDYVAVDIEVKNKPVLGITAWPSAIQIVRLDGTRRDEKGKPIVTNSTRIHL